MGRGRPLRVGRRLRARGGYWAECIANGNFPDQSRDETDFWQPDLPGRRGFDLAAATLGSKVEPVVADFQTVDLVELGQFDIVLYLGVLYHMKEPLTCLERVRAVTKEVAVIETEALQLQGLEHEALLQFHAAARFAPTSGTGTCPRSRRYTFVRAAGFSRVHTVNGPAEPRPEPLPPRKVRLGRRLAGIAPPLPSAPSGYYRAVVHAYV